MKTNNDYLAEYVREKRPEIERSFEFAIWKTTAIAREALSGLSESIKKAAEELFIIDDSCDEEGDVELTDNYDLFLEEDKRLTKLESRLPICSECKRRMYKWIKIDGKMICEDCVNELWEEYDEYEDEED